MRLSITLLLIVATCLRLLGQVPNIRYEGPYTYKVNNAITPARPINTGGFIPPNDFGMVLTYAGTGAQGSADGPASSATFYTPGGLIFDAAENLFVADRANGKIRKITPAGLVSTIAGTGTWGHKDGPANEAQFEDPTSLLIDNSGNIYVSDAVRGYIRKIGSDGKVSTLAGSGVNGRTDGQGSAASFVYPVGLVFDENGNIVIADANNHLIRKMTPGGFVTTFAGDGNAASVDGLGTAASFMTPYGITKDAAGNFYVSDVVANKIRKVTPAGLVSTFAGTGANTSIDGNLQTASFKSPFGIVFDKAGNLYVTELGGHKIRRISPTGRVTTVAGTGTPGFTDGDGNEASFKYITGLAINDKGNLFVGDEGNNSIRKIDLTGYTIDKELPAGLTFDTKTGIISGMPTVASPLTTYTITGKNAYGYSTTTVDIVVTASSLTPTVINFPDIVAGGTWDNNLNIQLNITSNNPETPIVITSSDPAIATVNADGSIHVVIVGTVTITANQAGSANYGEAIPVSRTIILSKDPQVISFPAIGPKAVCQGDFYANASSTNLTIPITYTSSNPAIATVATNGLIHLTGITGNVTITAFQPENNLYFASTAVSRQFTVSANNALNVSIAANQTNVCTGVPITFTATVEGSPSGVNYQWQVNGINAGANSNIFATGTLTSTDVVQCIANTTGTCPATGISNTLLINVAPPGTQPAITIAANLTTVCAGTPVTFVATTTNDGNAPSFQWAINGVAAGDNSKFFQALNPQNGDVVTCTVTNNSACLPASTATAPPVTLTVFEIPDPSPSVSISVSTSELYTNGNVTFTATAVNTGSIVNYNWQLNGENAGTNNPVFFSNNFKTGDVVTCTITTNLACVLPATSNAITLDILPAANFQIVNTFTPNGDGVNDTWKIPELVAFPNCLVSIFDRNGGLILQSTGYNRPWDGTRNGKLLSPGVYYYVIDLRNGKDKRSGSVTILK